MIDRFKAWFQYECQANDLTMQAIDSVPEKHRELADFKRAVSIFAHMVAARRIWLERFGVLPPTSKSMFSDQIEWPTCKSQWAETAGHWQSFLGQMDDTKLAESVQYQSLDAGRFSNSIEEVLTQLFGHGWYHRGQIAMLVRAAGGKPAVTDYIYFLRQPIVG